jgi:hypothetical protein
MKAAAPAALLPPGLLLRRGLLLSFALLPGWGQGAVAQEHQHPAAPLASDPAPSDPLLRVILEGPQVVLAHAGFLELSGDQVAAIRPLASAVCAGEVRHAREGEVVRRDWQARMEAGAGEGELLPLMDRQAALDRDRTRSLLQARSATLALLDPGQRSQVEWLREHWEREAGAMIQAATQPGHRGHPGMQLPIRVPGMVVGSTTLVPFCEALHGPAVHISIPPPR